jgi:hypothetical protein
LASWRAVSFDILPPVCLIILSQMTAIKGHQSESSPGFAVNPNFYHGKSPKIRKSA